MRESRTYGSVRGALSNERPYRVTAPPRTSLLRCMSPVLCRFSDAGNDDLATRSGDRRLKSAKARNRVGRVVYWLCRRGAVPQKGYGDLVAGQDLQRFGSVIRVE